MVDDHRFVRVLISNLLASEPGMEMIGEAENGQEAIALARSTKPDVVLLDMFMPGMTGLQAMKVLLEDDPTLKVMMISTSLDKSLATQCFSAGARGFFSKVNGHSDMIKAIWRVAKGYKFISANLIADTVYLQRGLNNPFDLLTERELQVAMLLVQDFSTNQAAVVLDAASRTVRTHRVRIFQKLSVYSDVELTRLAYRYGLLKKQQLCRRKS